MKRLYQVALCGALVWCVGCGIGFNAESSGCGGFETVTRALENDPDCKDRAMHFTWDADTGVVHFVDEGVFFNCCGERDLDVYYEDGVYVVYENEGPEGLFGGRCMCECLYDLAIDFDVGDNPVFQFRVRRDVSDDEYPEKTAWEGEVDVSTGALDIILTPDVECLYM